MTEVPLWSAHVTALDGHRTVRLAGELDMAAADELIELLLAELGTPGAAAVQADLGAVTFFDSAALGALIVAYQRAEETDRQFSVTNPTRPVRRVLEISGVYDFLVRPA
jgi:anti-anti-sigma factor